MCIRHAAESCKVSDASMRVRHAASNPPVKSPLG